MNVYVDCVGCEQRELEAQGIIDAVRSCGGRVTTDASVCALAVLITCAVSDQKEQMSLDCIRRTSAKMPKGARLVVGGCLPLISPQCLDYFTVNRIFSPRSMDTVANELLRFFPKAPSEIPETNRSIFDCRHQMANIDQGEARVAYEAAKRGFKIRIARGCAGRCSYCAIRVAIGDLESVSPEIILSQVRQAVKKSEPSVMLMAGDTGVYGRDIGTGLPNLLKEILGIDGSFSLFVHDLGPKAFLEDWEQYDSILRKVDSHGRLKAICIPVQSGSDNVLSCMQREYSAKSLLPLFARLRYLSHPPFLGTHILVGFPGESYSDFNETLEFLSQAKFDFLTCFAYSERPGTPSAQIYPKVSAMIAEKRLQILLSNIEHVKIVR